MLYKLRRLRKENGLTQIELSELIGIKPRRYSNYENGDRELPVAIAKRLGVVLSNNWWELYEEEE